jgi:hypothetical protein
MADAVYGLLESQIEALQDARVYARAVCEWVGRLLVGARDNRLEVGPYRHVLPAVDDLLDPYRSVLPAVADLRAPHPVGLLVKRLETLDFLIEKVRIPVDVPVFSTERKLSIRSTKKSLSAHGGAVSLWHTFHGFLGDKVQELCPELGLALNFRVAASKLVTQHWEALRRDLADVVQFDCEAIKDAIDRESQAAKEVCNASLISAVAASSPATVATVENPPEVKVLPQYVTIGQIAAVIQRSPRTVEKWKARPKNPLPPPDIEGGGGKADEWLWQRLRPWLEGESGKQLPERFPSLFSF